MTKPTENRYTLPAGYTITATAIGGHIRRADDDTIGGSLGTQSFGPYPFPRDFIVQGAATVTIAEASPTLTSLVADTNDVVELVGTGAPDDEVTGVGVAGPGSRYTRIGGTVALYINTGTKAEPTWTALAEVA